uniref:Uncharacterized protein n=1 Tax=Octopus bimaculoides TaxID=37653 RepID=A0A0L8ICZ2_OCTBM
MLIKTLFRAMEKQVGIRWGLRLLLEEVNCSEDVVPIETPVVVSSQRTRVVV